MPPLRLHTFAPSLQAFDLTTQPACKYNIERWQHALGDDGDLMSIHAQTGGSISRLSLCAIADMHQWRRAFLATMMWGYGTNGLGPWRTKQMLQDGRCTQVLEETARRIQDRQFSLAYDRFELDRCGSSFFTKYFYVLGLTLHRHERPLPLVLDERVRTSLLALSKDGDWAETWNPETVGTTGNDYGLYVQSLNRWADELPCRPDAIEYILFDPAQVFWLWPHNLLPPRPTVTLPPGPPDENDPRFA
jgi:hypothetical protein